MQFSDLLVILLITAGATKAAVFFIAVCRLSCCKRYRFALQNMAFYAPKHVLL